MAVTTQIIAGRAVVDGIKAEVSGAIAFTGIIASASQGANFESLEVMNEFNVARIATQNGGTVETLIASQNKRTLTAKFVPNGAARTDALAAAEALFAFTPIAAITTSGFAVASLNGLWNYVGGGKLTLTREGYAIADLSLEQQEVAATAGTFAGLAVIS